MPSASGFFAFLRAFGGRWFVAMSGPLTVPFSVAALYVDSTWARALFGLLAVTCALFTAFWLWRLERERVIDLESRLAPKLVFVREACCRVALRSVWLAWRIPPPSASRTPASTSPSRRCRLSIWC